MWSDLKGGIPEEKIPREKEERKEKIGLEKKRRREEEERATTMRQRSKFGFLAP
jgi:hypothetical protein